MTGIELLRLYANDHMKCDVVLSCATGMACSAYDSCTECRSITLAAIADQIERETLPRPLFDDGEPVQFRDCISVEGCKETVQGFKFYRSGPVFVSIVGRDHEKWVRIEEGERVKRPEPPDSWERVEADADKSICEYFDHDAKPCETCRGDDLELDCSFMKCRDLVRRCKALAGVE